MTLTPTLRPLAAPTPYAPVREDGLPQGAPEDTALVSADRAWTYAELDREVAARRELLGATRRLLMLECANDLETVATYLAAFAGGHPVLLLGPGDLDRHPGLVGRYDPDVVVTAGAGVVERRPATVHDLHPDLALLLATSGSTGSPKLVRLSRDNVLANADSIRTYLGLTRGDRAMTSLPLHYCYGLSVLNSHLRAGASVVLTDLSVVDACFWDLARSAGATSFAGVPYTFDLLDRSGFAERRLPTLRHVTQAGGRMRPEQVERYARLGREQGFELFVMYGQTEATARMSYLPPDLAERHPDAIGVPVPGGHLRIEPADQGGALPGDIGELVYSGRNVMLGYAERPEDLALGRTVQELRTGDLGRLGDDGLWRVVGRLSRFAKVYGLRIDLDRVEGSLREAGHDVRVVTVPDDSDRLVVFRLRSRGQEQVRDLVAEATGLPRGAVRVERVDSFPTTPNGKPDHAALAEHARLLRPATDRPTGAEPTPDSVRDLLAVVLARPDATADDSFVSLAGDSLSFVEASTRLADHLGALPPDWHRRSARHLAAAARPRRRRGWMPTEVPSLLRALAIVAVVVTHCDLVLVPGGAHVLLAVAGYNLSRFVLAGSRSQARVGRVLGALAAIVVPASIWIAGVAAVTGQYRWTTALLLNQVVGSDQWTDDWQFWFLEALALAFLLVAGLMAVPVVARLHDRAPFAFAGGVVAATLGLRYLLVGVEAGATERYAAPVVLWCLALGWWAATADSARQRLLVVVVAAASMQGFFGDGQREAVVTLGVALLLFVPQVPLPRLVALAVRHVGAASFWIYVTHWQVYPPLEDSGHPWAALVASILVGLAAAAGYARLPSLRLRLRLPGGGLPTTAPLARR
jgi:acyl-CoA synthetase (AMP-forming)/AMP-acid ligase II